MSPRQASKFPGGTRVQAGFTLVELMISMVLGLFIVLALATLLINVNRNNSELAKSNRLIENGRFAMQLLESDLTHAGFWGGYVPGFDDLTRAAAATDVPTAVPDPCLEYASWDDTHKTRLVGIGVQAYEIPSPVPSPTLSVCASRVVSPKANTDVLVVRHLDMQSCTPGTAGCPTTTDVYFQSPYCMTTAPSVTTPTYILSTSATTDTATFNLRQRNCTSASAIRKFVSNLYYVRSYATTAGDGMPTLMRSQFGPVTSGGTTTRQHKAADAMIEGIEGFRVELGLDTVSDSGSTIGTTTFNTSTGAAAAITWASSANLNSPTNRGDGLPDGSYVRCTSTTPCTPYQVMNAVAVKIYVLARSEVATPGYTDSKVYCLGSSCSAPTVTACPAGSSNPAPLLGPFCDGYKRHLFTQTVRLTNISMRRETP